MSNWKDHPATEKQRALLDKLNIKYKKSLTKGEASVIITEEIQSRAVAYLEYEF